MKLIVARAANGVIGAGGRMPWDKVEGDLERFKRLTLGHAVVMGRKTWESLPKRPLPGRLNLVLSSSMDRASPEVSGKAVVRNFHEAELVCGIGMELWCIGGGQVYDLAMRLGMVEEMHVTQLHEAYEGDVAFDFDPCEWRTVTCETHSDHDYQVWVPR